MSPNWSKRVLWPHQRRLFALKALETIEAKDLQFFFHQIRRKISIWVKKCSAESLHLPSQPQPKEHFTSPIYDDESSMLYKFPTRNFLIKLKCFGKQQMEWRRRFCARCGLARENFYLMRNMEELIKLTSLSTLTLTQPSLLFHF